MRNNLDQFVVMLLILLSEWHAKIYWRLSNVRLPIPNIHSETISVGVQAKTWWYDEI